MKITQRIGFNATCNPKLGKEFQKLGIKMKESGDRKIALLNYFDICEDDPRWPRVEQILSSAGVRPTMTTTIFTKKEIISAEWVRILPDFIFGYPMPDLDRGFMNVSFNPETQCSTCGIGREQTAPIRLKGEPKLGKNDFMGVNWTFDLFGRPEVFHIMLEKDIQGVEAMPAIHHDSGTPLKTIKQLRILKEQRSCIADDNLVRDKTPCGHIKYNVLTRGMMKFSRDAFSNMPDLVRTHEWFGSGHGAFQLVLASAKFVQVYMENNWKGLSLAPLELI